MHHAYMKKALLSLTLVLNGTSIVVYAAVLEQETLRAWREHIAAADLRIAARSSSQIPFLWTDESPERRRRVLAGEIVVAPVLGSGCKNVPGGIIHDWMGAIFIPNIRIPQLMTILRAYDRYKEYYRPYIMDSRQCASSLRSQEFSMIFHYRSVFTSFAVESQCVSRDFIINDRRRYSISNSVRVQEVAGLGTSSERRLEAGTGSGFVWDLHNITKYEERDGGVYLEMEALALSRNIPLTLRWMVGPLVKRLSMSVLEATLQRTRTAVTGPASPLEVREASVNPNSLSVCQCGRHPSEVTPSGLSK